MENTVRAENLLNLCVLFLFFLCAVSCHGGGVDIHYRYVSLSNAKGRTAGTFSTCVLLFLLLQSAHHDHWGQYLMTVCYTITMSFSVKITLWTLQFQGGMYVFQLFDHYACNGTCILFLCIFESFALGWLFGMYASMCAWVLVSDSDCHQLCPVTINNLPSIFWNVVKLLNSQTQTGADHYKVLILSFASFWKRCTAVLQHH